MIADVNGIAGEESVKSGTMRSKPKLPLLSLSAEAEIAIFITVSVHLAVN